MVICHLNRNQYKILDVFKEMQKPLFYHDIYQYFSMFEINIGKSTVRENMIMLAGLGVLQKRSSVIKNTKGLPCINPHGRPKVVYELSPDWEQYLHPIEQNG